MKRIISLIALTSVLAPRAVQALSEQNTKDLLFSNCMNIMRQVVKTDYQLRQTINQCSQDAEDFYLYIQTGEHSIQEAGNWGKTSKSVMRGNLDNFAGTTQRLQKTPLSGDRLN